MARVIHFEVSADNPERVIKFYSEVFGWEFKKMEMEEPPAEVMEKMKDMMGEMSQEDMDYWTIKTGSETEPGIDGGLSKRRKPLGESGFNAFVCSINVDNVDEAVKKVEAAGGKILASKMPIPGMGWFAEFEDPEKNVVGLYQDDKSANW